MALGEVYRATAGDATDVYYVDTGMYDTPEYGSVYVLRGDRPAIVDTGIGRNPEAILDGLADLGVAPRDLAAIVVTHVHLDHAGGAGFLAAACPNADVYVHERGAPHLVDPSRLWEGTKRAVGEQIEFYAEPEPVPEERVVPVADGDEIDLGDRTLVAHDAPGHAPHQAVFHDPASAGVFTADAAGVYTPGLDGPHPTTPPPDFDLDQCLADVDVLRELDPDALYYGHFGDAPADGLLDEYAEALTAWVEDIADVRAELESDEAVIERFVAETDLDEAWGARKAHAEVAMNVRGVLGYLNERGS